MSNCLPTLWQTLEDSFSEGKKEGILDHSSKTERIGGFSSDPRQKEGGEKCLKMTLAKRHVEKENMTHVCRDQLRFFLFLMKQRTTPRRAIAIQQREKLTFDNIILEFHRLLRNAAECLKAENRENV